MRGIRVDFQDTASYLTRAEWHPVLQGPLAEIWEPRTGDSLRLMVPKVEAAPDYSAMMKNLTTELARYEGRSPDQVREDIARQFLDITKLRAASEDLIDDTIPLQAGIALFESAKGLVTASAASTLMRQGNFGRNMPKRAISHAKQVRLGHTLQGSYILPIITEVRVPDVYSLDEGADVDPSLDLGVEEARFDRRVNTTMAHALQVLEEIAVRRGRIPSISDMRDAVAEGVSRELCDAISRVLTTGQVDNYDIDFDWAPAVMPPRLMAKRVDFPREAVFVVDEIASTLRRVERVEEQVIFGVVTNCAALLDEDSGRVTIKAAIDGRVRTVKFDLDWQSFSLASRCMTERRPVAVRGILHMPSGRQATMDVNGFGPDPSTMTLDEALSAVDMDSGHSQLRPPRETN
ncbi:hypothetical protein ACFV19_15340 [Streptomyces griseoluteus]|uniref:hypothetical protein n=1 Tax=Streptomyces griseoluteus TaxID=29306 RepID=UPI0036AF9BFE